ncbi:hypothetical protein ACFSR7_15880 [Cohnella sp. GCM10020058]|uniref:hypothetical protein n=1 Tax=Cohnella sp. GCM10020058 TaxID=3317330 RepID=UPI003624F53D
MYLMQIGISAKLLSELIQVTYKTAWLMNHKLRYAIEQRDADLPLEGSLQLLSELYGYEFHRHFSGNGAAQEDKSQSVVVGASVNEQTDMVKQLKIKRVECTRAGQDAGGVIGRFLQHHANDSSEVKIFDRRNRKERTGLHAAWTEAVRWLARTFGGIGPKHLQAYLDEFCFRRMFRSGSMVELMGLCGTTATIIYRDLVGKRFGVHPIRWRSKRAKSRQVFAS